jgi:hypothetical protein
LLLSFVTVSGYLKDLTYKSPHEAQLNSHEKAFQLRTKSAFSGSVHTNELLPLETQFEVDPNIPSVSLSRR